MRLIHAVREYRQEVGRDIRTIALYTEPDRDALFVREADEAVLLGPAMFTDPDGLQQSRYLDYGALEQAIVSARADAAWVGWGFVAEHPEFAELCDRLGVVFVGPPADVMRRLGDKISSKRLAEEAGIAVVPWSGGPVEGADDALVQAERLGFPLLIKASAGGGGRGIRRVERLGDVVHAYERASTEAHATFGDATVFMERLLPRARHIEVQILADSHGVTWAAGIRDCTLQRHNQKVVEESASTALTPEQEVAVLAAARHVAQQARYRGAGTVEFLYRPADGVLWFLEVNPRLQVEHPVTEATTGLDLVKAQLHIAEGGRLEGHPPARVGHAIEVRIYAEDPEHDFAPSPGAIALLRLPTGPGVRVDTGVVEGDDIPSEFDAMIAKLTSWGRDRGEALVRLRRALAETAVVIEGGATNRGFLLDLLDREEFRSGDFDNTWLDQLAASGGTTSDRFAHVALIVAGIDAYDSQLAVQQASFFAWARRGRPQAGTEGFRRVDLRHRASAYSLAVSRVGPTRYRVQVGRGVADVEMERNGRFQSRVVIDERSYRVISSSTAIGHHVEVEGVAHRLMRNDVDVVRAMAPGVVVAILAAAGDQVASGDALAVIESMKMETILRAHRAGKIGRVLVGGNVQVPAGAVLFQFDSDVPQSPSRGAALKFRPASVRSTTTPTETLDSSLQVLHNLILGYDIGDHDSQHAADELARAGNARGVNDDVFARVLRLLSLFADLRVLFRSQRDTDDGDPLVRSAREDFYAYLRSFDPEREGLPAHFLDDLGRALAHYGVNSLEPDPALQDAAFWIFQSQQRVPTQVPFVIAMLERLLEGSPPSSDALHEELRFCLDRLVAATEQRYPVIADLAREVRFRHFDEALLSHARAQVYLDMDHHLAALAGRPDDRDRTRHIEALVGCPQPLAPLLLGQMPTADETLGAVALEVMTRRYYRIREPRRFRTTTAAGHRFVEAEYDDGQGVHLLTTACPLGALKAVVDTVGVAVVGLPTGDAVFVDLYAWDSGPSESDDAFVAESLSILEAASLPPMIGRVVIVVGQPGSDHRMSSVRHYTFNRSGGDFGEDTFLRGLHPMMAERLQLSSLRAFEIERLPATDDVYLFHGRARHSTSDERLFALAEVRDLTPARAPDRRVMALPQMERVLFDALAGIRQFQARRSLEQRLHWNRVVLYVWPPLDLGIDEISAVARRLAPATEGLGIERIDLRCRRLDPVTGGLRDRVLSLSNPSAEGFVISESNPSSQPLLPLDEYTHKVVQARRRGLTYPYELIRMLLAPRAGGRSEVAGGSFEEHDLDGEGRLIPVDRPPGRNEAGIVVGVTRNVTDRHPEGMARVALLGDPTLSLGSLAEQECRRIIAALDLAAQMRVPVEWFALSAGAKISMDSGTENMDWIAAVLRRIIEFTQAGGEVNVVVTGINVGAQPYWNAEATMLLHTKGILVMTPESAMVLTGKQALDYSGGVSADDNFGIGGYEGIMGPSGQAQYWARDLHGAIGILLAHYAHAYVVPGERFPRIAPTTDPSDRDVRDYPHRLDGSAFATVGDIFSDVANPERKLPFDIRTVMRATIDQDHEPLERWLSMRDADTAVVWDGHLGGHPIALLGIESRTLPRRGPVPADGPDQWTSGTLFPMSSKKVARAINAASGNRPVVVLANLSGFDGSPDSMRSLQLEFGAEIGRAVVNFHGPIVFCVISRYHGGAFVVFSQALNEQLETLAVEGSRASVIGGAPAAAVVFAHDVHSRVRADPRVIKLEHQLAAVEGAKRARFRERLESLTGAVQAEKRGEVAAEFDRAHSVERALRVGSVSTLIPASRLRPLLIDAVKRGMDRELAASR